MAEPKELQKPTPYEVSPKGTIYISAGGELDDRGQIDELNDPNRNLCSVAYPPEGKGWKVMFECDGETQILAFGSVSTPDAGQKYAVVIRTRVQKSVNPPKEPETP